LFFNIQEKLVINVILVANLQCRTISDQNKNTALTNTHVTVISSEATSTSGDRNDLRLISFHSIMSRIQGAVDAASRGPLLDDACQQMGFV
jgi:hypothetical protein